MPSNVRYLDKYRETGLFARVPRYAIHNATTCTKVERRIVCDECGYPASEALFLSEQAWRDRHTQPASMDDLPEIVHCDAYDEAFQRMIDRAAADPADNSDPDKGQGE